MFDAIARRYDLLNRVLSLGLDQRWRRQTAQALPLAAGARVLDVATGTGDLALAILRREPGARVEGLDPSPRMLELARRKVGAARAAESIRLGEGEAAQIPFPDDSFDAVCMAFGMRNLADRKRALAEMARVTKPGGRVAVLELIEPTRGALAPLARFHIRRLVPLIGGRLSGPREYDYLQRSIAAFPEPESFAAEMREAGLEVLEWRRLSLGVCGLFVARPATRTGTEKGTP